MNAISSPVEEAALSAHGLAMSYGRTAVLDGIDFSVSPGTTLALLGPSGCGKTTLLRLVAGLLAPTRGRLAIGGAIMADAETGRFVPPERRGLGMVFQDYALWPHLSVARNVAFPLEMAGVARAGIAPRVEAALARVGLAGYGERGPGELSGGQQQRVAIARAIVGEPRIVLFDEPLSNLDRELREQLAVELAELVAGLSLTAVYVTHDQAEAFTVADSVAVMQGGRIAQLASPEHLVEAPASVAVAEFLKLGTLVDAARGPDGWIVKGTGIALPACAGAPDAETARLLVPRRAISLTDPGAGGLAGRVVSSQFRGDFYSLAIEVGEGPSAFVVQATARTPHAVSRKVGLAIEPRGLRWFPAMS